jgi:hypothetical protein
MGFFDKFLSRAPSRNEFAELVIRELAKTGVTNLQYEEGDFSLRAREKSNAIFLTNSYAMYCKADRQSRQATLVNIAKSFTTKTEIPADFAAARGSLMPQVRDTSYFSLVDLQFRAKGLDASRREVPTMSIADGLQAGLAFDTERSILQVNLETFCRWGVKLEEAFQTAKDNLRDRTDPKGFKEIAPALFEGQWADSYESSRMLLTDLVYRLQVNGDPIAYIPNRNEFCVTGTRNAVGLKALLKTAEEAHFGAHPLSPNLYVLRDGSWQLYVPDDLALLELWRSIKRRRATLDYKSQKDSLDTIYKREKVDVFLPNYFNVSQEDGSKFSACVWSKGVDSLLPKVDFIVFMSEPKVPARLYVAWDRARSIVGGLMEEEAGMLPPRYRVRSFPDAQQLAELGRVKTDIQPGH